ncbi:MAG: hypothetical protein QNJ31_06525 [Candidatus Caenarcaniphilales bacterium]|nr:hypothetical protein [Candidatus Caenarcaniphilales bacterium]
MKLVTVNDEIYQNQNSKEFLLDLQKLQIKGHRPYPYWNAKYLIPQKQLIAIPENIYSCWTGKLKGVMGSQYNLQRLFVEEKLPETIKLPLRLIGFPPKEMLKWKKFLCVLAHNSFGLGDLILSMPFLKVFAESLDIELGLCVNAAGVNFFHEQKWISKIYPEIVPFERLIEFDYFIEPSVNKMDALGWIRSFVLKELGEQAFLERFPSPKLIPHQEHKNEFYEKLSNLPKRDKSKKLCLLNWETSSQKRNLPFEVVRFILQSLLIMDFQVVVTRPIFKTSELFNWISKQNNVIDASSLTVNPSDLVNLVDSCDLIVTADTSFVHLAGGLRKKTLCVFAKSAGELYKKAWLKGTYWPLKAEKLYPTLKTVTLLGSLKEMDKILYQAIRNTVFNEDPETIELYNNLFAHLKNSKQYLELEEIMKRKNIDFRKLFKDKVSKQVEA